MPLRPIDAIFVHPQQRCYVIYYRGELWQLARMKLDNNSWQRRQPYKGDPNSLFLSQNQAIEDLALAGQLRTLALPDNLHGTSLPKFEDWWLTHGFDWLKDILLKGDSPLAGHARQPAEDDKDKTTQADKSRTDSLASSAKANAQTNPERPLTSSDQEASTSSINTPNADASTVKPQAHLANTTTDNPANSKDKKTKAKTGNIFDDMLAELAEEVLTRH